MKILIVDDHRDSADSIAMLLELQGHQTFVCYSAKVGLAEARRLWPDVILHDLSLPEMGGHDAVKILRADPQFTQTLIVAMTAFDSDEDREQALLAGFDALIGKPVDISLLKQTISRR